MKISIITVCRNSAKYLESCINSTINQSHKDIEYIVIDGASTDGTLSLLKSKYDKLITLVSEPDDGIYDAMNKGINLANGEIIGFLNSDDFYENDKVISKVANLFKNDTSLDCCYADLIYVNRSDTSKNIRYVKSSNFKKGLFYEGWCPPHPTFFVRKSIYEKYGNFNLNYKIASDVDLMIRFLEVHGINTTYIPEVWVKMRIGGTTNKSIRNIFLQNQEILSSLKTNGLKTSILRFLINKIISRSKQYLYKSNE